MTGQPIRVLLIDDHSLFRSGIRLLLARSPDFEIVGEAGDAAEGIKQARQTRPDVVLLDLHMPGISGHEAARMIATETPDSHILMLTVSEEAEDLFDALRAGACGYLVKNIEAGALEAAVRSAANGESVISPQMMGKLLAGSTPVAEPSQPAPSDREEPPLDEARTAADVVLHLTRREREILRFLARGCSNKEIARDLSLAESTVKIHVQNLLRKLRMSSRVQAAVFAVEQGLVPPEDTY